MPTPKVSGTCHICGNVGPLSKEHVPPKSAFNNGTYINIEADKLWNLGPDDFPHGKPQQGGINMYTLCEQCNNIIGRWYGETFAGFCRQGMTILQRSGGKPSLVHLYHSFPLRILKQIETMLFSVNSHGFASKNPELVDFVLSKTRNFLPPKYRFFIYYNTEGKLRYSGITVRGNTQTGGINVYSEITFPPFGYVMTLNSPVPDLRLTEITDFAWYGYNEFLDAELQLPTLPTHLAFPGDYRTKQEIYEQSGIQPSSQTNNHGRPIR